MKIEPVPVPRNRQNAEMDYRPHWVFGVDVSGASTSLDEAGVTALLAAALHSALLVRDASLTRDCT